MGGAQIAVTNDESALYINPAGLLRLRDPIFTVFDPEVDFSQNFYYPVYSKSPMSSFVDPNGVASSLVQSPNEYYYFKYQLTPTLVSQYLGLGLYLHQMLQAYHSGGDNLSRVYYRDDQALYLGTSIRLFDGHLKLGASAKLISRIEVDRQMSSPGNFDPSAEGVSGLALGYDVGMILVMPWKYHPTLSIVGRDLNITQFNQEFYTRLSTIDKPASQLEDYDVALAWFPNSGNNQRSTWTFEVSQIKKAMVDENKLKYSHFGYEYNLRDILFVRAGINQKYWTFGFEVASERTQFQFATYGEDVGYDSHSEESRRYVLKWSYRF